MSDKEMFPCYYPEFQEVRESTTFWSDFSIADRFGHNAIRDTFKRAFNEWKGNYKYLTELVVVLNRKCWQHYGSGDETTSKLYKELYDKANDYGINNLKGEEGRFFFYVLD